MLSTFKFKKNIDIGSLDAESDRLLLNAFVEKHEFTILQDTNDTKSILIGRTGSGKSALIKYLENKEEFVIRIDPESLSLRHLSNSDIINYFKKLDVKLDMFYKLLWKHVFIVELIKMYFQNDMSKSRTILEWIKEKFKDQQKRKKAIEYLEKWEEKFWEDTEYRIKELETSLENRFKGEFNGAISIPNMLEFNSKHEDEVQTAEKVRYEIVTKAQKVVNESHIEEIREIFLMMKNDLFNKTQKRCYIVIDDLDKEWVSNKIVYDLIKGLIETIKEFSEIPHTKIIIALRSNIHRKIFKENITRGVQREKYNHLYINLEWTSEELKELINNRLRELMKGTYTNDSPTIEDILPETSKKQQNSWTYILDRTFMRPRDVIDFFNKCIKHSEGKTKFTRDIIRTAETEYSTERLQALNDEWLENFGSLECLYGFLNKTSRDFKIADVESNATEYFIKKISSDHTKHLSTELQEDFRRFGEDFNVEPLLKKVLLILFEVGILGVKINPESKQEFIHESYAPHDTEDFTEKTKFQIHPMFYKSLRIT